MPTKYFPNQDHSAVSLGVLRLLLGHFQEGKPCRCNRYLLSSRWKSHGKYLIVWSCLIYYEDSWWCEGGNEHVLKGQAAQTCFLRTCCIKRYQKIGLAKSSESSKGTRTIRALPALKIGTVSLCRFPSAVGPLRGVESWTTGCSNCWEVSSRRAAQRCILFRSVQVGSKQGFQDGSNISISVILQSLFRECTSDYFCTIDSMIT